MAVAVVLIARGLRRRQYYCGRARGGRGAWSHSASMFSMAVARVIHCEMHAKRMRDGYSKREAYLGTVVRGRTTWGEGAIVRGAKTAKPRTRFAYETQEELRRSFSPSLLQALSFCMISDPDVLLVHSK
jgi:hypothetical protein